MSVQSETCQHPHTRIANVGPTWNCDVCHSGPHGSVTAHLHCALCDHDVCDACEMRVGGGGGGVGGDRGTGSLSADALCLCPQGHATRPCVRTVRWQCDQCRSTFPSGTESAHCDACDFDCCPQCSAQLQRLVCPSGHPLRFPMPFPQCGDANAAADPAWRCDVCHGLAGCNSTPCRCARCDYDVCASCLRAALTVAKHAAAAASAGDTDHNNKLAVPLADPDVAPWGDAIKRLVPVQPGSDEFASCVAVFQPTLPANFSVHSISRIENSVLFKRYSRLRRDIANGNGGDPNLAHVVHGTGKIPTATVALDDDGIDMRFSNTHCMFGCASYFSHNTAYVTRNYAHRPTSGSADVLEFLVCEVARGNVEKREPGKVVRPSPGYHCVEGFVSVGVLAVMCYQLHQSYPCYHVTVTAVPLAATAPAVT